MEQAKSIKQIIKKSRSKYGNEEKIIGVINARYGMEISNKIIKEHYVFWDVRSQSIFNLFWLGYFEDDSQTTLEKNQFKVDIGSERNMIFDMNDYVIAMAEFESESAIHLRDKVQLYLFQYNGNTVNWNDRLVISLDTDKELYKLDSDIRKVMLFIIEEVEKCSSLEQIRTKLNKETIGRYFTFDNVISVINVATSLMGISV